MKPVQFAALVLTALALIAPGAHLFALPNKIGLPQDRYFIVQAIYYGWALTSIIIFAAIAANSAMAYVMRRQSGATTWALLAAGLIVVTLVIFFIWTFPANQATQNWLVQPSNWVTLRTQWEYSHAVNAVITFMAFCCTTLSVLSSRRGN
jgi:hypothetical protein